jgi:hypothetical protein
MDTYSLYPHSIEFLRLYTVKRTSHALQKGTPWNLYRRRLPCSNTNASKNDVLQNDKLAILVSNRSSAADFTCDLSTTTLWNVLEPLSSTRQKRWERGKSNRIPMKACFVLHWNICKIGITQRSLAPTVQPQPPLILRTKNNPLHPQIAHCI